MSEQSISTITKEQLIDNGWEVESNGSPVHYKKDLVDKTHEWYDPEDGELSMVLHSFSPGYTLFGVMLPDGGILNINPASIEELNAFEKQIIGYDPPY